MMCVSASREMPSTYGPLAVNSLSSLAHHPTSITPHRCYSWTTNSSSRGYRHARCLGKTDGCGRLDQRGNPSVCISQSLQRVELTKSGSRHSSLSSGSLSTLDLPLVRGVGCGTGELGHGKFRSTRTRLIHLREVTPSFALMDVQGPVIVTYVYQLVDGEVSFRSDDCFPTICRLVHYVRLI
jgi:hypothetical protein